MMNTLPDITEQGFDFKKFLETTPTVMTWSKSGALRKLADFGTIIIGLDLVTNPDFVGEILNSATGAGPVFMAPGNMRWSNIAAAFGIFKSATQARKNGWDGKPNPGFNFKQFKINKIRGELLVLVINDDSPWVTEEV